MNATSDMRNVNVAEGGLIIEVISISIVSLKESTVRNGDAHTTEFRKKAVWRISTVIHAEQVYPAA